MEVGTIIGLISKRLIAVKVTESEIDPKTNPSWLAYFRGQIKAYETVLRDLNNLSSGGPEDLSTERPEIFEVNKVFTSGLEARFKNYDLQK